MITDTDRWAKPSETLTAIEVAFPTTTKGFLPEPDEIPEEFRDDHGNKWCGIASHWFFKGMKGAQFKPKEGVNQGSALMHLQYVLGSWEPEHEQ